MRAWIEKQQTLLAGKWWGKERKGKCMLFVNERLSIKCLLGAMIGVSFPLHTPNPPPPPPPLLLTPLLLLNRNVKDCYTCWAVIYLITSPRDKLSFVKLHKYYHCFRIISANGLEMIPRRALNLVYPARSQIDYSFVSSVM